MELRGLETHEAPGAQHPGMGSTDMQSCSYWKGAPCGISRRANGPECPLPAQHGTHCGSLPFTPLSPPLDCELQEARGHVTCVLTIGPNEWLSDQ